ncbi:MAG: hypothetical protein Q8R60_17860 [Mycobacteriales bacterium]|nr:hypothetical protein [Mycobacteriales bacterium]
MRLLLAATAATLVLTGCGSGDGLSDRGLTVGAAEALEADVAAVVSGVEAKDGARARNALKELRAEVERQLAAGEITQPRADEIRAAADALPLPAMPVVRTPTPTPTKATVTSSDDDEGKGKGKGRDKDDD